jgi:hypothetical protein
LRRFTPGYLDDLSDTKFRYEAGVTTTDRQTLLVPPSGKRIRLVRLTVVQTSSDGTHWAEVYFGNGTNIGTDPAKAIDVVRVADLSEGSTRTWARGTGPVGTKADSLSLRWTAAPATTHAIIIEYTEER